MPEASPPTDLTALRARVAELLGEAPEKIGDTDDLLLDWGLDSMHVMTLVGEWQAAGIEVAFTDLAAAPTLAAWDALIAARRP